MPTCDECGTPYTPHPDARSNHRYCTVRCRRKANNRAFRAAKTKPHNCTTCGATFTPTKPARYCSTQCEAQAKSERYGGQPKPGTEPCTRCGHLRCKAPRSNPTLCIPCHRWVQAERRLAKAAQGSTSNRVLRGGTCRQCGTSFVTGRHAVVCSRRCHNAYHRAFRKRLERHAIQRSEPIHRHRIYERDDWTCQLCGDPVDRDAVVPHPLAPTLDHIHPLARGGDHAEANLQLAHFLCNATKSDTLADNTYREADHDAA